MNRNGKLSAKCFDGSTDSRVQSMSLAKPSTVLGADMLDVSGFNVSTKSRGGII